jgi:hypothetical protein
MDIQGFTSLVLDRYSEKPEAIYAILKQFKREQYIEPFNSLIKWRPEIVSFSDSIVRGMSSENSLSDSETIVNEVKALRLIQQRLFVWMPDSPDGSGIYIRGGLTAGLAFIDTNENIVFGSAMIKAYSLENVRDSPFRIVVDQTIANKHPKAIKELEKANAIAKDDDGLWFIDYFSVNQFKRWGFWIELKRLRDVHDILQTQIRVNSENSKLLCKYAWAAKKHNAAIRASKPLNDALKNEGFKLNQLLVQVDD